jgi:CubicO group peptidase (beta-lactamase class C family)
MKFARFLIRFCFSLILAVGIICLVLWASGNVHLIKAVRSTYLIGKTGPSINDYTKFVNRQVKKGASQAWPLSKAFNNYDLSGELLKEVEQWETTALLIAHKDSILFEKYWDKYSSKSLSNSFSMAKSFTSLAIGAAIKEGKISSPQQKLGKFIPEYAKGDKAAISIEDLLTMSSGIDFGESYGDPFGFMAKTYYGENLYELTLSKEVRFPAGTVWKYQGGNTLLLSFILKEATGEDLSSYFSKKFWQKIGAQENALWTLDKENGREKAYCCFYSNARDFARIGQLMLDSGEWNGEALISKDYYLKSLHPANIEDEKGKNIDYYGYQWWMGEYEGTPFYYARGIQGQYIVWVPEWEAVLVRLGNKRDPSRGVQIPSDLFTYLEVAKQAIHLAPSLNEH